MRNVNTTTAVGLLASVGTGIALLPQLVKLLREQKAQDISWLMMISLFVGNAAWVVYGVMIQDPIILVSNAFSFTVNCLLATLNLRYRRKG